MLNCRGDLWPKYLYVDQCLHNTNDKFSTHVSEELRDTKDVFFVTFIHMLNVDFIIIGGDFNTDFL